jgi:hypothetical protein
VPVTVLACFLKRSLATVREVSLMNLEASVDVPMSGLGVLAESISVGSAGHVHSGGHGYAERLLTGDREGAGDGGASHGVQVLPEGPAVEEQRRQAIEPHGAVRRDAVPDEMLHPGVGRDDKIAGEPRSEKHGYGGEQVRPLGEPLFAERKSPRNEDSRKKANMPSIACVCPMTPPANREKRAQFVPN